MNKLHFIYALVDPRTDGVRYVGKTIELKRRMRRHRNIGRSENPSLYRDRWIQSLMDDGLDFIVWVLEICDDNSWAESEKKWIAFFKDEGCRLTNLAEGGTGGKGPFREGQNRGGATPGRKKPAGFGEKISKASKGVPKSKAHREAMSRAKIGNKASDETKKKVSEASKVMWKDSNFYENRKIYYSSEHMKEEMSRRAKLGKGVPKSDLTKKRMSESAIKRPKFSCDVCGKEYTKNNMVIHMRTYHTKILV